MKVDILIAHPGKHHVYHLIAGCIKSGATVSFITPFYRSGFGWLVSAIPGRIGNKAKGYFHPDIPRKSVISPFWWQIKKLIALFNSNDSYEHEFDEFVAKKIDSGEYQAKILVTLQDYMPKTVHAAKKQGFLIWSDQILNQSFDMAARIMMHEKNLGLTSTRHHSEHDNHQVIALSDVITAPSNYCSDGFKHRITHQKLYIIPYGANPAKFSLDRQDNPYQTIILARAQSFRKGGHLLLRALELCGASLLKMNAPQNIKVVILGELEPVLQSIFNKLVLPEGLTIEYGNVAYSDVHVLYQKSSIFVMPSLSEGMSLACMEAMHASLPLIITKYCGIDEFISGEMGYEIDDTSESLSIALINAFKNKHLWKQWGCNSKILAKSLTWVEYEKKICKLAEEILL